MFTSRLVLLALGLVFAIVNVVAIPVTQSPVAQRDVFEPILAYVKRDLDYSKRAATPPPAALPAGAISLPEEVASKSITGQVENYVKRAVPPGSVTLPEEEASKSPDGKLVSYVKRIIPSEMAVRAPDGIIELI